MNYSGNKICAKNYFHEIFGFFPSKSQIRKSSKVGFPENAPKIAQFHKHRKSSEMVVRGWYMTHFDRRDLLQSKKQVWGGFRNLSDLPNPIREFSQFFWEISTEAQEPKTPSAPTFESDIFFQKLFFDNKISFP